MRARDSGVGVAQLAMPAARMKIATTTVDCTRLPTMIDQPP